MITRKNQCGLVDVTSKIMGYVLRTFLFIVILINVHGIKAEAANKYCPISSYNNMKKINGIVFELREIDMYTPEIVIKKNGVETIIDINTQYSYYTDGKTVYYMRKEGGLYKYTIKTGKKEKVISGMKQYSIMGCTNKYVYISKNDPEEHKAYVVTVKTKKKKSIGNRITYFKFTKKRVITGDEAGQAYNGPIYSMKYNGTGKKKIAKGCGVKVKGNTVYYEKVDYSNGVRFKVYSCTVMGKKHKALTGWLDYNDIPKKYK